MPEQDLLGYLLGLLDAEEHAMVGELLQRDFSESEKTEELRCRIALFEVESEFLTPRFDLAQRVCQHIRLRRKYLGDAATDAHTPRSWLLCAPSEHLLSNLSPELFNAGNHLSNWLVE